MVSVHCWPSISAMRGASLVNTKGVIKVDYGCHLYVLTITNSLLSNAVVTCIAITSV